MNMQDIFLQHQASSVFARMPLMIDAINIMNRIEKHIDAKTDLMSLSIKTAIKSQVPYIVIIKQLQEQVDAGIGRMFPLELMGDIINFKG